MKFPFPSRPHRVALAAACGAALALGVPLPASASTADDVKALKKAMADMKADYDRRLATLEAQLKEARATQAPAAPPVAAATPESAPTTPIAPATVATVS